MYEVRTGLSSGATLQLGGGCTLTIDRLTRVVIHRLDAAGGEPSASRIVVALQRGRATVSVTGATAPYTRLDPPVTVTTPDWIVLVREATEVTYDAAQGTRTRSLDEAPVR